MITGKAKRTKQDYVVNDVLVPIYRDLRRSPLKERNLMQVLALTLMEYKGIGSFMAGQITADMRWAAEGTWSDRQRWAPMGPGSHRGMNRVLGRDLRRSIPPKMFERELANITAEIRMNVPPSICSKMEAIDFQNCLCEFDKYERTLWEGRRPKQRYPGV